MWKTVKSSNKICLLDFSSSKGSGWSSGLRRSKSLYVELDFSETLVFKYMEEKTCN